MGAVQLKEEAMDALNYQQLKSDIHRTLLAKIDLEKLAAVNNERRGVLEKVNVTFRDDRHLMQIIDRIVGRIGRRVDESSPMVDARLLDGSRVNAIIPPLALDGPCLSIRRFGA